MLSITWSLLFYVGVVYAGVITPTQTAIRSIPTSPWQKRYIIYNYYVPTWDGSMTCGVIQPALAAQAGLYGTTKAASITAAPYPIVCEGICADSGNHLGCIDWTAKTVGTTCTDYNPTNTACDVLDDGPCYWDMHCDSTSPACITLIYSGTVTQYTCGANKVAPITVDSATMTPYTPSPASTVSTTGTAATATSTSNSDSGPDSSSLSSFEKALKKVGLSIGALAGICAGALAACCAACCGCHYWKKGRNGKKKYAAPYMHEPVNPATVVQQPLMAQPPAYHNQYHQKQPQWTAIPQTYNQHEH